jgi:hypothetical protein
MDASFLIGGTPSRVNISIRNPDRKFLHQFACRENHAFGGFSGRFRKYFAPNGLQCFSGFSGVGFSGGSR